MKLITTLMITALTIPKGQLQLCRIKTNNKRQVEKTFLDQLFKFLKRNGFDFISTEKQKQLTMLVKI